MCDDNIVTLTEYDSLTDNIKGATTKCWVEDNNVIYNMFVLVEIPLNLFYKILCGCG